MLDKLSIVDRIERDRPGMTRAFRLIADFLASDPQAFIRQPIRDVSDAVGVSEPSLIRFARSYGFKGFPDLRLSVAMSLAAADSRSLDTLEPTLADKEFVRREAKNAIAQAAAPLVLEDSSIIIDSGSTATLLTQHLMGMKPLTILTTGLHTIMALRACMQHRIILPGGTFRPDAMSLGGRIAESALSCMSFDTVYMGADSVNTDFGLSTFSEEEAHLNRAMIRACRRVVVLADASKFRSPALHQICELSEVDILVTDSSLPLPIRQSVEERVTRLIICEVATSPAEES